MLSAQRPLSMNTDMIFITLVLQPGLQAGEPATTVHFVEEGRVLVAANFLNLPEAQRAVDFPETLLTGSLEWCARARHAHHNTTGLHKGRSIGLGLGLGYTTCTTSFAYQESGGLASAS
jgi:hypothetical protein